jgi:8-oxo-dGTP diphosphatase
MKVQFYDKVDDKLLKFAVIISKSNGKWVFCKHKERDTYEVPPGNR